VVFIIRSLDVVKISTSLKFSSPGQVSLDIESTIKMKTLTIDALKYGAG